MAIIDKTTISFMKANGWEFQPELERFIKTWRRPGAMVDFCWNTQITVYEVIRAGDELPMVLDMLEDNAKHEIDKAFKGGFQ